MASLPTPPDLDTAAARALREAKAVLQRGFAEGIGTVRDFPRAATALKELADCIDQEQAVEASRALREHPKTGAAAAAPHAQLAGVAAGVWEGAKNVAVFVDGSSNSYAALRWAAAHALASHADNLFVVNVLPFPEFDQAAGRTLQQAYDFAHFRGVSNSASGVLCTFLHAAIHLSACMGTPAPTAPPSRSAAWRVCDRAPLCPSLRPAAARRSRPRSCTPAASPPAGPAAPAAWGRPSRRLWRRRGSTWWF
jgi:hypothetical protein